MSTGGTLYTDADDGGTCSNAHQQQQEATPKQLCYAVVDSLLDKFGHAEADVAKVMQQRVPAFVEKAMRIMEERDVHRMQVENCIGRIFAENQSRFMHNEQLNAFYRVDDDGSSIRMVPSDTILLELARLIPASMYEHRAVIKRGLKALIRKQCIFQCVPHEALQARVQSTLCRLFGGSQPRARAFMYVLGAIMLKNDAAFDRKVHLWYGPCAYPALESFQSMISQITQSYSPLWNRIRSRMHHSYFPLTSVSLLHFDLPRGPHTWDAFHKTMHGMRESIVVACCQAHREIDAAEQVAGMLFDHPYTDVDSVWEAYQATATGFKTGYVHMDEIIADFRYFCSEGGLPDNLLTPTELKRFADSQFVNTRHRMNAQILYKAALSTPTFYDLFDQFCTEILVEPPCEESDVEGISSGRLYNTFEAWSQYLEQPGGAGAQQAAAGGGAGAAPVTTPAQQKYPYNMFDAFLHQRFMSSSSGKWRVFAHASADMVRYYMACFQQARKAHLQKGHGGTGGLPKSDSATSLGSLSGDQSDTACPASPVAADFPNFKDWCIAKYGAFTLHPATDTDVACEINNELVGQVTS